jgi:hypothetical protein
MTVLRTTPYSLSYGTLIVAKIKARNAIDWSTYSAINSGGSTI